MHDTENMIAPPSSERVLVVDDEPDIVALVAYHLAKSGYRVSTAANGYDALGLARQERPALVVLDLMLPGLSGFDVMEQLRADDGTREVAQAAGALVTATGGHRGQGAALQIGRAHV